MAARIKRRIANTLNSNEGARFNSEEIHPLTAILSDKPDFFGNKPTSYDVTAYAF